MLGLPRINALKKFLFVILELKCIKSHGQFLQWKDTAKQIVVVPSAVILCFPLLNNIL